MQHGAWERVPIDAQSVEAPLSRSAVFLVHGGRRGDADLARVRDVLGAVGDLVKNVGFRDLGGRLSCVVGIGSALWDRLSPGRRPTDLHPFPPIQGPVHAAPSTPGDLLFHIRAEREDMTFELERQLLDLIGDAARVVDETTGFRYFDARDLLGFVDGTANPTGAELPDAALIGADADPEFAGGSYVVVQKYLHDMAGWAALSTEEQEAIMGRTKIDNIEIDDDEAPRKSHKSLATIEDDAGRRAGDPARQHALRPPGRRRVRDLLHRLRRPAVGDRADARADVRRRAAGRLRPAAGLLDRDHRDDVLRAHGAHARGARRAAVGAGRGDRTRSEASPQRRRRWASARCAGRPEGFRDYCQR